MAIHTLQVTIGAGVTRFTTTRTSCAEVTVQNNASHAVRVGDSTTTSSKGIALAISGAANSIWKFGPFLGEPLNLTDFYVAGTQNDVLDVTYVCN